MLIEFWIIRKAFSMSKYVDEFFDRDKLEIQFAFLYKDEKTLCNFL